jgi:hypothetical protein
MLFITSQGYPLFAQQTGSDAKSPLAAPSDRLSQPVSPLFAESPLALPATLPEIEPGKALVIGRIISRRTAAPLANTIVRLPEVYCIEDEKKWDVAGCFWALDNAQSPSANTDENGYFEFPNVIPRKYALFIGDISTQYMIVLGRYEKPGIWNARPDEVLNLGNQIVDFP